MKITRISAQQKQAKKRIAVYCRVSTKQISQEDSLEMQEMAYSALIALRSDWELAGVYSDSMSGLSAERRPQFMKMIRDAEGGKIDRILCKSVSRFSRNIVECKKYTDRLLQKNVAVEFEKEHINTDDPTSSFIFSLMSAIAENESRSISENVRWGYRERFKRGEYNLGNNRILGYKTVNGKLVPNKDADAVKLIFALYLKGETIEEIRRRLTDIGVRTKRGKPLSHGNILYILKNETYKGDKLLQKKRPKDPITKKPDPTAPYQSYYLTDDHKAIVSKADWETVQQKLKKDKKLEEVVGHVKRGQPHFLFGKVLCGECGEPMTRRTWGKRKVWICRKQRNGVSKCTMRKIEETELLAAVSGEITKIVVMQDGLQVG